MPRTNESNKCDHVRTFKREATHTVHRPRKQTLQVCRACSRRFPKDQVSPLELEVIHGSHPT